MDQLVRQAMDAIERRDWDALKLILHPYLHWSEGRTKLRGRSNVLAHLAVHHAPDPPTSCEIRDGQIYRGTG